MIRKGKDMNYLLINDFSNVFFQQAFKEYFKELEMEVNDWNALFASMNSQGGNLAYLLLNNGECLGFIQFRSEQTGHWFITENFGFIREFWIRPTDRKKNFGRALLKKAEKYFVEQGILKTLLTTDTSSAFYVKNGYKEVKSYKALNNDPVYSKELDS